MKNKYPVSFFCTIICLVMTAVAFHAVINAQEKSKEKEEEYAEFIGDWEFNVEELGPLVINLYVEDGILWGLPEGREKEKRVKFIPIEGKELEFKVEASDGGIFEWTFFRDDKGHITKCSFYMEKIGLEAFGTKKEKSKG